MQFPTLLSIVAAVLVVTVVTTAENCTDVSSYDFFQSLQDDSNYAACKNDTNVTLSSSVAPWALQTSALCSSSACQALLSDSLVSGILPDCEVVTGRHTFNLTDVVASIMVKCAAVNEFSSLEERAVDETENHNKVEHVVDNILHAIEHAIPMEEILL